MKPHESSQQRQHTHTHPHPHPHTHTHTVTQPVTEWLSIVSFLCSYGITRLPLWLRGRWVCRNGVTAERMDRTGFSSFRQLGAVRAFLCYKRLLQKSTFYPSSNTTRSLFLHDKEVKCGSILRSVSSWQLVFSFFLLLLLLQFFLSLINHFNYTAREILLLRGIWGKCSHI